MKKIISSFFVAAVLTGCHTIPVNTVPLYSNMVARDATLMAPNYQYQETPQSKSIIVGSQVYAIVNSCTLIKRYRVVTNADFTGSLNLMKYRASLMGAKWLTVVSHRELDRYENSIQTASDEVIYRDGVDIGSSRYLSTVVADLYDCPCNINSCSGR
jgi:hypothetical protein